MFELQNTGTAAAPVYASAPTTLISFDGSNGAYPYAGLTAEANGDLFGTTHGAGRSDGEVFESRRWVHIEVTDSGTTMGDWNLNAATDWSSGSAPNSSTPAGDSDRSQDDLHLRRSLSVDHRFRRDAEP